MTPPNKAPPTPIPRSPFPVPPLLLYSPLMKKLFAWDASRLAWPTRWADLFGREADLLLEIGFGDAEFLVDLAVGRPEKNILGIEISLPSIKKAESKAGRLASGNVQIVHGDARVLLWGAMPPGTLAGVFINFPDPWPKAGQRHRQLVNDDFLDLLATRMAPGADLDIATDDTGYQESIADCLRRTPYFRSRISHPFLTEDPERLVTKYEQKARREGRISHYFKWGRNTVSPVKPYETLQELVMPHAVLSSSMPIEAIPTRFLVQRFGGEIPIRLLNIFRGANPDEGFSPMLLIETHIAEDPLPQRLALFVQKRRENELLVGVHELGFPRPTPGVHLAVSHLARWLLDLDEGMGLIRHNLNCEI